MTRYKLRVGDALKEAFEAINAEQQVQPLPWQMNESVSNDYPINSMCSVIIELFAKADKIDTETFQTLVMKYHSKTSMTQDCVNLAVTVDDEHFETLGERYRDDEPDTGRYWVMVARSNGETPNKALLTSAAIGWYYEYGLPARQRAYAKAVLS